MHFHAPYGKFCADCFFFFFSELCWGKAMVAYTMPQQSKRIKGNDSLHWLISTLLDIVRHSGTISRNLG